MTLAGGSSDTGLVLQKAINYNIEDRDCTEDAAKECLLEITEKCKKNKIIEYQNEYQMPTPLPRVKKTLLLNTKIKSVHYSSMEELPRDLRVLSYEKTKKLIPVDFDLKLDEDEEQDDDELPINFENKDKNEKNYKQKEKKEHQYYQNFRNEANKHSLDNKFKPINHEYHRIWDTQLASYDLATQWQHNFNKVDSPRCRTNKNSSSILLAENSSVPFRESGQISKNSNLDVVTGIKPTPKPRNKVDIKNTPLEKNEAAHLDEIFFEDRLSLTLDEIVHIRSVLTKAELESLPTEGCVKEDVEKRRICFLCLKTRFGLLGPWGQRCRLCERTVCVKCYSRMKIPVAHFAHVPVILLSPGFLLSPSSINSDSEILSASWAKYKHVGSAPTSPATKRYSCRPTENKFKMSKAFNLPGRSNIQEQDIEQSRSVLIVACHDCRIMVTQIIKNSRITRTNIRNDVISRLTLNLSPAYV